MNNELARAFVLSRLDDGQVHALHAVEKREGYLMPPCWIHERFGTPAFGEVPEEKQARVAPVVIAILRSVEGRARAKKDFPGIEDLHAGDWEIRKRRLDFSGARTAAATRERLLSGEMI